MKTKNIISALAVVLMAMITMVSCEKSKTVETIDIATAEDDAIMDMAFDDVFSEVDAVMNTMDMVGYELPGLKSGIEEFETCKVITVEQPEGTFWPRLVTVDYGEGCTTGKRTRKGKIIITVSGPMWMEGSMRITGSRGSEPLPTKAATWKANTKEKSIFPLCLTAGKSPPPMIS